MLHRTLQAPDDKTILDPFMGSGTTGVAATSRWAADSSASSANRNFGIACRRMGRSAYGTCSRTGSATPRDDRAAGGLAGGLNDRLRDPAPHRQRTAPRLRAGSGVRNKSTPEKTASYEHGQAGRAPRDEVKCRRADSVPVALSLIVLHPIPSWSKRHGTRPRSPAPATPDDKSRMRTTWPRPSPTPATAWCGSMTRRWSETLGQQALQQHAGRDGRETGMIWHHCRRPPRRPAAMVGKLAFGRCGARLSGCWRLRRCNIRCAMCGIGERDDARHSFREDCDLMAY